MISVCIPVFNFDITQLVADLSRQAEEIGSSVEIILIDDASDEKYKKINAPACVRHTYVELNKNVGRAKIRNLFLDYALNEFLLFIDCDSKIISDNLLSNYIKSIKPRKTKVICGGSIYDKAMPEKNKMLRWKYGNVMESQSAEIRNRTPNNSFMTNNVLINRHVFDEIKFDERISEYGHEDTLFGFQLKKKGIQVLHIENPVLNNDIDENGVFLEKTEKSILNLITIAEYTGFDKDFVRDVAILNFYKKLNSAGLTGVIAFLYSGIQPFLNRLLVKGYVNLRVFNFYKLGFLIQGIDKAGLKSAMK